MAPVGALWQGSWCVPGQAVPHCCCPIPKHHRHWSGLGCVLPHRLHPQWSSQKGRQPPGADSYSLLLCRVALLASLWLKSIHIYKSYGYCINKIFDFKFKHNFFPINWILNVTQYNIFKIRDFWYFWKLTLNYHSPCPHVKTFPYLLRATENWVPHATFFITCPWSAFILVGRCFPTVLPWPNFPKSPSPNAQTLVPSADTQRVWFNPQAT